MRKLLISTAATAMLLGGASANAAFVDFTSEAVAAQATSNPFTLTAGGVSIEVLTSPASSNFDDVLETPGDFCESLGGLFACDNDGLGITNDEIGPGEALTLTFSQAVNITSLSFLDLFVDPNQGQDETVQVMVNGTMATTLDGVIDFSEGASGFAKFTDFTTDLGLVSSISFLTGEGNDGIGIEDFAFAGIEFSPVPVPAAGLLFGTAALGGALARRKRQAA